jgi:hypothetical protein
LCLVISTQVALSEDRNFLPRIIGGIEQEEIKPYIAMLLYGDNRDPYYGCAGSLIAPDKIVTAAHCVDSRVPVQILLGKNSISSPGGESHKVKDITIHPLFDIETLKNDLAIITLTRSSNYKPIALASNNMLKRLDYDSFLSVSGWGYTDVWGNMPPSDTLITASVHYIPPDICSSDMFYGSIISKGMLCAGYVEGGIDACGGDSGGPLTLEIDNNTYLVGLVSWGASGACAQSYRPGVYTNLTTYQKWLDDIIFPSLSLPKLLKKIPEKFSVIGLSDTDGDGRKEVISMRRNQIIISQNGQNKAIIRLEKKNHILTTVDLYNNKKDSIAILTPNGITFASIIQTPKTNIKRNKRNTNIRFLKNYVSYPTPLNVVDAKWGFVTDKLHPQLIILTDQELIILNITNSRSEIVMKVPVQNGQKLLTGKLGDSNLDSIYVFDGTDYKIIHFSTELQPMMLSLIIPDTIATPKQSYFYDIDNDGHNELISIVNNNAKALVAVARYDESGKFGTPIPWFELPRNSIKSL